MQNNSESNKGSPFNGKLQVKQQQRKEETDKFDEELDEGKRILDQLNEEFNEKQESRQLQADNEKDISREIASKSDANPLETIGGNEKRQIEHLIEMEQEKDESIQVSKNMNKKTSKIFQGCNCLKSKCSKNYCECFTQGRRCNQLCKCMGCENHSQNENRLRVNIESEGGERACFCKKSNCLKKYCECYNNGAKCTNNCKCEQCKNTQDPIQNERQPEQAKAEPRKERSEQEIEEINTKIDEITRMTPPQYQELMISFLEYWLS